MDDAYSGTGEDLMEAQDNQRRLAVILAADMVGYSRLVEADEEATISRLRDHRSELIDPKIREHYGRIVKSTGDGLLVEFASPVEAVRCAVEVQFGMAEREAEVLQDRRIQFRIGINLGDVMVEGDDILGDGVNVAARLEGLADPGGIWISGSVYEQVNGKVDQVFDDLGHRKVKNIAHSIHVYQARIGEASSGVKGQPLFDFDSSAIDRSAFITGGCMCGDVRYEISPPAVGAGFCHCRMCQRSIGAPVNAWVAFPIGAVRFTGSEPKYYGSSLIGERGFCANCGTSLTYRMMKPEESEFLVMIIASMDRPEDHAPTWHGGIESQMPWLDIHDDLPRAHCKESSDLQRAWGSAGITDPADWK
jgi:class 3 adenylate cyclase